MGSTHLGRLYHRLHLAVGSLPSPRAEEWVRGQGRQRAPHGNRRRERESGFSWYSAALIFELTVFNHRVRVIPGVALSPEGAFSHCSAASTSWGLPPIRATAPWGNPSRTTGGQLRICPQEILNESKDHTHLTKCKFTHSSVFLPQNCSATFSNITFFRGSAMGLNNDIRILNYIMPATYKGPNLNTNSFPLRNSKGDVEVQRLNNPLLRKVQRGFQSERMKAQSWISLACGV